MFFYDIWYIVLVVPAIIISFIASSVVKSTFNKYNNINAGSGINSNEVVEKILRENEIYDVSISTVRGNLTDNYNPSNKTLNLSQSTSGSTSIGAIGVAAHEAGHAVQYKKNYFPVRMRSVMVPMVNIGSKIGLVLVVVGLFMFSNSGSIILDLGIALYSLAFLFTLITLPVEFNASKRAIASLEGMGYFSQEEINGARKVLNAAAMTYVASMLMALASLIRILLIVSGRQSNRRD